MHKDLQEILDAVGKASLPEIRQRMISMGTSARVADGLRVAVEWNDPDFAVTVTSDEDHSVRHAVSIPADDRTRRCFRTLFPLPFEKAIDELVSLMFLGTARRRRSGDVSLSEFDRCLPIHQRYTAAVEAAKSDSVGEFVMFQPGEVSPRDVPGCNVCFVSSVSGNDGVLCDEVVLNRVRLISPRAARGRLIISCPSIAEHKFATLYRNGKYESCCLYYGHSGKRWVFAGRSDAVSRAPVAFDQAADTQINMALSMAFSLQYEWSVSLSIGGGPSVCLLTDVVGAREAFALRDLPNGKTRRTALIHWVRNHWRKKHDDPSAFSYVHRHLRGSRVFVWNDLRCEIAPSQYDIKRLAEETAA